MGPLLIVVGGATGSGKTDLALRIAGHFGSEILSADSRQVYREIPIGSAAPDATQLAQVRHHLVGSHSIHEAFNAGIYADSASALLEQMFQRNPIQVAVGGTGLYLKALIEGLDALPEVSSELREHWQLRFQHEGLAAMQGELRMRDPEFAATVDLQNPARVLRALELLDASGKTMKALRTGKPKERNYRVLWLSTDLPREVLYERINRRTQSMMDAGWVNEARNVYPFRNLKALQTVGFTELFDYFDGTFSLDETLERIRQNTRRYAKRQITWFGNQTQSIKVHPDSDAHTVEDLLHYAV